MIEKFTTLPLYVSSTIDDCQKLLFADKDDTLMCNTDATAILHLQGIAWEI